VATRRPRAEMGRLRCAPASACHPALGDFAIH